MIAIGVDVKVIRRLRVGGVETLDSEQGSNSLVIAFSERKEAIAKDLNVFQNMPMLYEHGREGVDNKCTKSVSESKFKTCFGNP